MAGGLARDGTGGGGVLETLGRLTSEWEEPHSKEAVLMEREGAGEGAREDTLDGTSGSVGGDRGEVRGGIQLQSGRGEKEKAD